MVLTAICPLCEAVARVTALDPDVRPLTVTAQCTAVECAQSFLTSDKTRMLLGRGRTLVRLTQGAVVKPPLGCADTSGHATA